MRTTRRRRPAPTAGACSVPKFDKKTIALVYDFDGTLSPEADAGIRLPAQDRHRPGSLLGRVQPRCAKQHGADPLITYMHLHVQEGEGAQACASTARDLVAQGKHVELFPGVEDWFDAIGDYVKSHAQSHGVAPAPLPRLVGPDRDHRGHARSTSASTTCSPPNTGSRPTTCPTPSASSPTPARRSTCSASTRASRTWARASTSTCPRTSARSRSPT